MADVVHAAQTHMAAGRFEQAQALLTQSLARNPNQPLAIDLLAGILMRLGRMDQAKFYARRSVSLRPGDPNALFNLGKLLVTVGEAGEAIECFQKAAALEPDNPVTLGALTNALNVSQQFDEAERVARRGLERWPEHVDLMVDLASSLQCTGRVREAVPILRRASALAPDDPFAATLYAGSVNYAGDVEPGDAFEAHRAYGRLVERAFPGGHLAPRLDPDPERRLRLAVLSGDLRAHACGYFIEPLLEHHDKTVVEITCLSTASVEDAVSARLRRMAEGWKTVTPLTVPQLADLIRKDRYDIILEMSGHTGGHRLQMFQLRPAPISITYFGYPNTTGVSAIDYRLVDSITDPCEPWYDGLASEKLWRLDPCFLCYKAHALAPAAAPPPSASGQPFTFGSFNNLAKHDEIALDLYRRALEAVPGSRMMFKYGGLQRPEVRERMLSRLAGAGVDASRVILEPPGKSTLETLPSYAKMDLMLDSFPYHGTTTTCESLYMGVPVVTMMGRVCAARVSGSILANIGLGDLVAQSPEEYASIAAGLARDPARLASIRSGLRARMLASPVCDGPGFARRMEAALRAMWRAWCASPA
jgi:predicted O-linked N-acetylglucosamine transferase (SPINDLY family)